MKRILVFLTAVLMLTALVGGCGGEKKAEKPAAKPAATETKKAEAAPAPTAGGKKILVAYFSRTGEEYNVGVITKGNTAVVADAIAEITGADKFEIKTVKAYPQAYRETTEIAKKEKESNVRPEIVGKPENLKDYDTVFLGYPIWWTDLPIEYSGAVKPPVRYIGNRQSGVRKPVLYRCGGAAIPEIKVIPETVGRHIENSFTHSLPDPSRKLLSWNGTGMSRQEQY